jgi:glycosyltransferase involved in cell wall biosynthesis
VDHLSHSLGGSEQHLCWLMNHLPDSEVTKRFAMIDRRKEANLDAFPLDPYVIRDDIPKRRGIGRRARQFLANARHLARLIHQWEIDLIHAFWPTAEWTAQMATVLARRGRVIGVRRNVGYTDTWTSCLVHRCVSRITSTRYLANSEAARRFAHRNQGIPRRRIGLIYNPVSNQRIEEGWRNPLTREELGIPGDGLLIGMVATVRPIKDYACLLRAVKGLVTQWPNLRVVCVGRQVEECHRSLVDLAKQLEIEKNVYWTGGVENPCRVLPLMDVAVLSSRSESFSNATLEYAAMGRPMVVTDVGGQNELVEDGKTGFLVPAGDASSLADRIALLLRDSELRKRLGKNAKSYVDKNFTESKIIGQFLDFYHDCLLDQAY